MKFLIFMAVAVVTYTVKAHYFIAKEKSNLDELDSKVVPAD